MTTQEQEQKQENFCDDCGAANPLAARCCQNCGALLPFAHTTGSLPEQTLLASRYQLLSSIGQGGMGAVYKAADTSFNDRPVAIKEMSSAGLSPSHLLEAEDAFTHEAHLLAGLLHPNLPRIYDHFTENDRSYLVMDFIEGHTLEEHLEKIGGGPLPISKVLGWAEQLCDVLHYLHTQQPPVIFRDLKPSNVMISKSGHIFLIDFGIARIFKPGKQHDTVALGSPGYAAPEQYGKAQSTPRSDIYSLGALLHYLLTGIDPSDQPFFFVPVSQANASINREITQLLQNMVEMDAQKRPDSAEKVLEELQRGASAASSTSSGPLADPLLEQAQKLYSQKRLDEALTLYNKVVQSDTTSSLGWQGYALTQGLRAHHKDALDAFERA
ncbi:MAG TPA: serine/threonine-protein kinase, partial [Ktedonobacteraceae bacterium]|nr:serine/threonine-protein kinase [Ktedonobacteraceae bacterium]